VSAVASKHLTELGQQQLNIAFWLSVVQSGSQQQSISHLFEVKSQSHMPLAAVTDEVAGLAAVLGTFAQSIS
jgi:hypothetical protein